MKAFKVVVLLAAVSLVERSQKTDTLCRSIYVLLLHMLVPRWAERFSPGQWRPTLQMSSPSPDLLPVHSHPEMLISTSLPYRKSLAGVLSYV